ncbi:MAG: 2Fe-2S iron-sulfur cluster binding domain-containing protein [Candidatus Lokiarchaeota archaeon]|nr:2Fe-2S iron-sulfur cluster binding domain-containing protein [Candidatus Lokiarchaeota archaeon]
MEKEIMEDVKQYQKAEKLKKKRDEVEPLPWYYDGLENLCNRIHPGKQLLQVTDIELLSRDTKLFRFISAKPNKPLAPFRAGQYIGLTVDINGVRTSRPFSLASSPNQLSYYELGIRRKDNGFVSPFLIENLKVGDILEASEPLGNLFYNPLFHGKDLVFIAGGSGITPFISMLRDISEKKLPINVWLIFGCLTEKDILFRTELNDIQKRRSNINISYILSEPNSDWKGECGFITRDKILNEIGTIAKKYFYMVGNRAMYEFVREELNALGIPQHRVYYEAFGVPDDITKVIGWPQEIDSSDKIQVTVEYRRNTFKEKIEFEALCSEPILNSLERSIRDKIEIANACRSGECALCRTRLISGKVFVPPEVTIREVDKNFGSIHPCISYPITNVHLDLTLT